MSFNSPKFKLIRFIVGLIILVILFYRIGLGGILDTLKTFNLIYFTPIITLFLFSWFIAAFNIFILLKPLSPAVPYKSVFKYYWLSKYISLFMPGRIGDFSISWFLKKNAIGYKQSITVLLIDKLVTLSIALVFGIIGIFKFLDFDQSIKISISVISLLFISCFILTKRFRKFFSKYILRKHSEKFTGFSDHFYDYWKKHSLVILQNYIITIVRFGCTAIYGYFIFCAFGVVISLWDIFLVTCIGIIITMIPITVNGLGIRQSVGVYIFSSILGVNNTIVGARYLIVIILNYGIGFLTTLFYKPSKQSPFSMKNS